MMKTDLIFDNDTKSVPGLHGYIYVNLCTGGLLHNNRPAGEKTATYSMPLKEYACLEHFLKLMVNDGHRYPSNDDTQHLHHH